MKRNQTTSFDSHEDGLELNDIRHAVGGVKQHSTNTDIAEQALDAHHMLLEQGTSQAHTNHASTHTAAGANAHHAASAAAPTSAHVADDHGQDAHHMSIFDHAIGSAEHDVQNAIHNCHKAVTDLAGMFGEHHVAHHIGLGTLIGQHVAGQTPHGFRIPFEVNHGPAHSGAVNATHSVGHSPFFGDPTSGPHHNPWGGIFGGWGHHIPHPVSPMPHPTHGGWHWGSHTPPFNPGPLPSPLPTHGGWPVGGHGGHLGPFPPIHSGPFGIGFGHGPVVPLGVPTHGIPHHVGSTVASGVSSAANAAGHAASAVFHSHW